MATISTSGIASGSIIRAEHVLRVIESLSGDDANDILISGSVGITGSFTITSGSITKTEAAPMLLAYNTSSGGYKWYIRYFRTRWSSL
jgi:phage protein U